MTVRIPEDNWRENSEEERRKVYIAIENIIGARPKRLEGLGVRLKEIADYTNLPPLAIQAAIKALSYFGVIIKVADRRVVLGELPLGFCWRHGLRYLNMGECRVCKEKLNEKIEGEDW